MTVHLPQYLRLDNLEPTPLTQEEILPYVYSALEGHHMFHSSELGEDIVSVEEGLEVTLRDHHVVVINEEYVVGYSLGTLWFTKSTFLVEEYLTRINEGDTTLREVFEILKMLARLHGAKEVLLAPDNKALKRLYAKYGAKDSINYMRIA